MSEPEVYIKHTYDNEDAAGTVTMSFEGGIPTVVVEHLGGRWEFTVDLYYLSENAQQVPRTPCVQIVCHDPRDQLADPVQHVRVFSDGHVKTFVS